MYQTISLLHRCAKENFDVSYPTRAQADAEYVRFVKTLGSSYLVGGVLGRIVWQAASKELDVIYVLPQEMRGLIVGVCATKHTVPNGTEGFSAIGLTMQGEGRDTAKLVFGQPDDSYDCGNIPGLRPTLHIYEPTSSYIIDDHLDRILYQKVTSVLEAGIAA